MTPNNFVDMEPPDCVVGVRAISSIPDEDNAQNTRIRSGYGTRWMKYGATSFVKKEGRTSARRTTALGTFGPTRSRAAESIITYSTLFMRPRKLLVRGAKVEKSYRPNNQNATRT